MKSYINTLADYHDMPMEREVTLSCPPEHIESQMRHLTRAFKRNEPVQVLERGDVAVLALESELEKFNRPAVFVTVGGGIFHSGFEAQLIGHMVGEDFETTVDGKRVRVRIQQADRTIFPEPTDEMAEAYAREHEDYAELTTVDKYRNHVIEKYLEEKRREIIYRRMDDLLGYVLTHSDWELDEDELLGLMDESRSYISEALKEEGLEYEELTPESRKQHFGVESPEELEQLLREEAERRIAMALWNAAICGKDAKGAALEELEDGTWEFLEDYVKENVHIKEER